MRNISIFVLVMLIVTITPVFAETMQIKASFGLPILKENMDYTLTIKGCSHNYIRENWPAIPYRLEIRELPFGTTIQSIESNWQTTQHLILDNPLPLTKGLKLLSEPEKLLKYESFDLSQSYPADQVIWSTHGGLDPLTLQHKTYLIMRIFPVQYSRGNQLDFTRELTLTIKYETPKETPLSSRSNRFGEPFAIIIPESFLSVIPDYIAHKAAHGLTPGVHTIENILASTPGTDDAEKLRIYIRTLVEDHTTSFVLLAGDADVLPVRRTFQEESPVDVEYLPIESYFSDLYNGSAQPINWDYDGNEIFGTYPADMPAMDFLPDVFVSRIPASTPDELQIALNHVIAYELGTSPSSDWFNTTFFTAVDIFNEHEHGETSGIPEGELFGEFLSDYPFTNQDIIRLYETDTYPRDGIASPPNVVSWSESGSGFFAFHCHGAPDCLWLIDDCFTNEHAMQFQNGDEMPVMFGFACSSAAFDNEIPDWPYSSGRESMPEHFLLNPNGGAISYVGATRVAFGSGYTHAQHLSGTGALEYPYFCAYYQGMKTPPMMLAQADLNYIETLGIQGYYDYFTVGEYAQFGDPTLRIGGAITVPELKCTRTLCLEESGNSNSCFESGEIFTVSPTLLNTGNTALNITALLTTTDPDVTILTENVTYPDLASYNRSIPDENFRVQVESSATTSRIVTFIMEVSIDSSVYLTEEIHVFIGTGSGLKLNLWELGYDSTKNGNADPGDHLYPLLFLQNIGCEPTNGLTLEVSTDSLYTDWCQTNGGGEIGTIPTGYGSTSGWGNIDLGISENCPDGTLISLDITITDATQISWEFPIDITVLDKIGPRVSNFTLSSRSLLVGDELQIQTEVFDVSGVESVQANLQPYPSGVPVSVDLFDDGLHGDVAAGDGIYGAIHVLDAPADDFIVNVTTRDNLGNDRTYTEVSSFSTIPLVVTETLVINSSIDLAAGDTIVESLNDAGITNSSWEERFRGIPDKTVLMDYDESVLIWTYGWSKHPDADYRIAMADYLDNQGAIILCGWDLARNVSRNGGKQWLEDYFGVISQGNNVDKYWVEGLEADPLCTELNIRLKRKNSEVVYTPDIIQSAGDAEVRAAFQDLPEAPALITRRSTGQRAAFMPFALENVKTKAELTDLLSRILPWLADHPKEPAIQLDLNNHYFEAGMDFILTSSLVNPYPEPLEIREFIALSVGDYYWFWPSWIQIPEIDYSDSMLEPFETRDQGILNFVWPETGSVQTDLRFYGLLISPETGELLSDLVDISFGFGN